MDGALGMGKVWALVGWVRLDVALRMGKGLGFSGMGEGGRGFGNG